LSRDVTRGSPEASGYRPYDESARLAWGYFGYFSDPDGHLWKVASSGQLLAGTVAKLTYLMLASLDGYIADEQGRFDWAEPDEDVHTFVNQLDRPVGTHLYGRRMYEGWSPGRRFPWTTSPRTSASSPRSGVRPTRWLLVDARHRLQRADPDRALV
jgi:hypothetical protein